MPWNNTCPMNERHKFIKDWLTRDSTVMALCDAYQISRKTGYKWIQRFRRDGQRGLNDKSRKPHSHPWTTDSRIEQEVLRFRAMHPFWGPRKIRSRLQRINSAVEWPAASTIGSILTRHGIVVPRRRRARVPAYVGTFSDGLVPNDVWAADFKGWFRTKDGTKIDPFTVSDVASRYLIRCHSVSKTDLFNTQAQLTAAFQEFGLPKKLRTDNGQPFASCGLCGLSRLAIWLIRLGVMPERIRPGHPEENGVHERMHRTLKQATAKPPKATFVEQQEAFDIFRIEYNDERPHEALGMRTPSELFAPSPRCFPRELPRIEYDSGMIVRRINETGQISWKDRLVYTTRSLAYERVGIREVDNNAWDPPNKSMKFLVANAPSHSVNFRTPRLRLFERRFGPYSNGPTGHPWDKIEIVVPERGPAVVTEIDFSGSFLMRLLLSFRSPRSYKATPEELNKWANLDDLMVKLKSPDEKDRSYAAIVLYHFNKDAARAVTPVIAAARKQTFGNWFSYTQALHAIAGPNDLPLIVSLLSDHLPAARRTGVSSLGVIGAEPKVVIPYLITALADSDPGVKIEGLKLLGSFGKDAAEAVPKMIPFTAGVGSELALTAVDALDSIGTPEAIFAVDQYWRTDYEKEKRR